MKYYRLIARGGIIGAVLGMLLLFVGCPGLGKVGTKAEREANLNTAESHKDTQVQFNAAYFLTPSENRPYKVGFDLPPYFQLAIRDELKVGVLPEGSLEVHLAAEKPYQLVLRFPGGEEVPGYIILREVPEDLDTDEPLFTVSEENLKNTTQRRSELVYNIGNTGRGEIVFLRGSPNFMERLGFLFQTYREELLEAMALVLFDQLKILQSQQQQINEAAMQSEKDALQVELDSSQEKLDTLRTRIEALTEDTETEVPQLIDESEAIHQLVHTIEQLIGIENTVNIRDDIQDLRDESDHLMDESRKRRERIEAIELEIQALQEPLIELEENIERIQNRIRAVEIMIELYELAQNPPSTDAEVAEAEQRMESLLAELRRLDQSEAVDAQLQLEQLDEERALISNLFTRLFSIMNQLNTRNCGRNPGNQFCLTLYDRLERTARTLKQMLDEYGNRLNLFGDCESNPLDCLRQRLDSLRQEEATLQQERQNEDKIHDLRAEKQALQQELTSLTNQLNQINGHINNLRDHLRSLHEQTSDSMDAVTNGIATFLDTFPDTDPELKERLEELVAYLGDVDYEADPEEFRARLKEILEDLLERKTELDERVIQMNEQLRTLLEQREQTQKTVERLNQQLRDKQLKIEQSRRITDREIQLYRIFFARYAPSLLDVADENPIIQDLVFRFFTDCEKDVFQPCYAVTHQKLMEKALQELVPPEGLMLEHMMVPAFSYTDMTTVKWDTEVKMLLGANEYPFIQPDEIWGLYITLLSADYISEGGNQYKGVFEEASASLGIPTKRLDTIWWYLFYNYISMNDQITLEPFGVDPSSYVHAPPFALRLQLEEQRYEIIYTPEVNPYTGIPPYMIHSD
jgi:uncharacterized coiled-coil DUF342 family protein